MFHHPVFKSHSVDTEGNIYGVTKKLRLSVGRSSYLKFSIYKEGRLYTKAAHRFIWEAYNNCIIPNHLVINHIDGNKTNNKPSNLEVCTQQENTKHSYSLGLQVAKKGQEHPLSKLKEEEAIKIIQLQKKGMQRKILASLFEVSRQTIDSIILGTTWSHLNYYREKEVNG